MKTNMHTACRGSFCALLSVIFLVFFSINAVAQDNSGKEFWYAQTPNSFSFRYDTAQVGIVISNPGLTPASILITPGNTSKAPVSAVIAPGSIQQFLFSAENLSLRSSGKVLSNVYHITSDQNVVVYGFNPWYSTQTNDASLLLPVHALGKKYMAGSYINSIGNTNFSFYGIVATQNNTSINVYNRANALVETITLQKGEYWQNLAGKTPALDVTGWFIESDKNIAVFTGNQSTSIGNSILVADHIEEQLFPIETLGSAYIAAPTNSRPIGCTTCAPDVFRYVATENNTAITSSVVLTGKLFSAPVGTTVPSVAVTLTPNAPVILNRGEFIELATNLSHIISGSNPFYAFQYLISEQASGATWNTAVPSLVPAIGDPDMMNVPVAEQFQFKYNFIVPSTFDYDIITIVAPENITLSLSGNVITPNWKPAGTMNGVNYQTATHFVSDGAHVIGADKKFGLIVSGFGAASSYSYVGGSKLEPINAGCVTGGPYQVIACNAGTNNIQLNGNPSCEDGSTPVISWSSPDGVVFSDSQIANPIATVYGFGTFNVTLTVNCGGNITVCTSQIIIREKIQGCNMTIQPPPNILITAAPGQPVATNVNIGTAIYTVSNGPGTLVNNAPQQFPIGVTTVIWTVTDVNGESLSGAHTVTVLAGPPVIAPPAPITIVAGYDGITTNVNLGTPSYSVAVDPATVTNDAPSSFAIGQYIVAWTVSDGLGQTASGNQSVTIVAPQPTIAPMTNIYVNNDPGEKHASGINIGTPIIQAVGPYTLTSDAPAQFPIGITTVVWTLTDVYGKVVTASHTVTVVSDPPTITAPGNITVNANAGQAYATGVTLGNAAYTVSVNNATVSNDAPSQFPVGNTTVTWTVKDGLGRTASATQVVTVKPSDCSFVSTISSIPTSTVNTGGNPNRLYLGYGAQSTKLQANFPVSNGGYTVNWTGGTGLSSYTSAAPIFSATTAGSFTFTCKAKNNATGCTTTSSITICVTDARSLDKNGKWDGKKVIVCHLPPGNPSNVQYIDVSINAVPTHVPNHGGDGLGNSCTQTCNAPTANRTAVAETFGVNVYPNPASSYFILQVRSDDRYTTVSVRIMDAFGRTVDMIHNAPVEKAITFGEKFASGAYYAEVIQGENRKLVQLVKAK